MGIQTSQSLSIGETEVVWKWLRREAKLKATGNAEARQESGCQI